MFFNRRGGVELVSIIILAVILGAATISIAVGLSKNAKNTAEGGLSANNSHLSALYQSLEDDLDDISYPGGGGGGEVEYGTAGSAQVLEGYTIATTAGLIEGTMRRNDLIDAELESQNTSYSIPEGYHDGNGKVTANITNLVPANIKKGVNVGGVVGTYEGSGGNKQLLDIYIPGSSTTNVTKKSTNIIIPSDVVFETDRINLTCGGNDANGRVYHAAFCFPTLIDFTGQNFFVIDTYMYDMRANGRNLYIYLMNTSTLQDDYSTKPTPIYELPIRDTALFASSSATNSRRLGVIDVRDISGSYYIHVVAMCSYWERINVDILRMFFMP